MPRTHRPATLDDLKPEQRRIFDLLPDDLRHAFFAGLAQVKIDTASQRRSLRTLEKHLNLVDGLIGSLAGHRDDVVSAIEAMREGEPVRVREVTSLPAVSGVTMRLSRRRRGRAASANSADAETIGQGAEGGEVNSAAPRKRGRPRKNG